MPLQASGAGEIAALYAEMNQGIDAGLLRFDAALPVIRGATSLDQTLSRLTAAVD